MSLPTIEPIPEETAALPPARRRRQRRMILPAEHGERAEYLRAMARRTVPSFDFFLYSLLSGLVLSIALLIDSPALMVLAALIAPFLSPLVGISLGTIAGTSRFVLQSLGSLGVGSLIVFLCGTLAGWMVNLLPQHAYQQAVLHSLFSWPDWIVLLVGAGLITYLIARTPDQKPAIASAAIVYELYLPIGAAGFAISSGMDSVVWLGAMGVFLLHLLWAILIGTVTFALMGIRPLNPGGYILAVLYGAVALMMLVSVGRMPSLSVPVVSTEMPTISMTLPTSTPSAATPTLQSAETPRVDTATPTPGRTNTLVFTRTPTLTITPVPTPVLALIAASEGGGALIREKPGFDTKVIKSLLNGTLVEILPEPFLAGNVEWVRIRAKDGMEGWIVRDLIRTATPVPTP